MRFKKKRPEPRGEEIKLGDPGPPSPADLARMYVGLYLVEMAGRGETRRMLRQSEALPVPEHYHHDTPAFSCVIDYLKERAGLEPVIHPEPNEGMFEMSSGGRGIKVHVRTGDGNPERTLEVRMVYGCQE
jgi:hypothetical protein